MQKDTQQPVNFRMPFDPVLFKLDCYAWMRHAAQVENNDWLGHSAKDSFRYIDALLAVHMNSLLALSAVMDAGISRHFYLAQRAEQLGIEGFDPLTGDIVGKTGHA